MKKFFYLIMVTLVVAILVYGLCPKPEIKNFTTYSSAFFDKQGGLLRITLAEDDRYRLFEPLEQISPNLIAATILYEDQSFYSHTGVDYLALLRAFWQTYIINSRRIGASTITMQLARLRWSIPSHTLPGKIQQIFRAIQLTRHYSKDEILQSYLNLAPYGRNIEGIAAASLIYFNKKPSELNLPEALTLAVIPQNPNKRNPTTAEGYSRLLLARENLLQRWLENYPEDLSKQVYFDMPLNIRAPEQLPFLSPHFVNYLLQNNSRWHTGIIQTTLDSQLQKTMEAIISSYISSKSYLGINNASALLVNYQTMEMQVMLGSADFNDRELHGQVNGVLAKRSPGSSLKPFVYALAMDEGLIHPMTLMKDSPGKFGGFTPENYDKRFLGPIVVKDALIQSRNLPAVELQSRLRKTSFYEFLQQADISGLQEESFYGLALALGGGEVSMLELVRLYAGLANKGEFQTIMASDVDESSLPDKKLATKNQSSKKQSSKKLLSAEAAFLVLDMLKDNPQPDELLLHVQSRLKNDVAWKTGTSWAYRDAWAIGVSGPYVLAVWVGNFDGKGNASFIGRSAAGPLLFTLFNAVFPAQGWKIDSLTDLNELNIKKVKVCKNTGGLYSKHCPSSAMSWFIPGVSPITESTIYREIPVDKSTGLRACWSDADKTQMQVFEFWPTDFLHIFRQAGISLKTPPKFAAECSLDQKSSSGQMPIITSPQTTLTYVINSQDETTHQIPFSAITDPDVESSYWFVNGKYIGSSTLNEQFIWRASSGEFNIRVVDDSGRSASSKLHVRYMQ